MRQHKEAAQAFDNFVANRPRTQQACGLEAFDSAAATGTFLGRADAPEAQKTPLA